MTVEIIKIMWSEEIIHDLLSKRSVDSKMTEAANTAAVVNSRTDIITLSISNPKSKINNA